MGFADDLYCSVVAHNLPGVVTDREYGLPDKVFVSAIDNAVAIQAVYGDEVEFLGITVKDGVLVIEDDTHPHREGTGTIAWAKALFT